MVTQVSNQPEVPTEALRDRGFVAEQPGIVAEYRSNRFMFYPAPFWGPVIAGTLFVFSTFVLSWYLMLACTVGVNHEGLIMLGWGSAIWMWVTSAIAYYAGGMIASMIAAPRGFGWLKGAAIWGLSIPLGLVAYSFAARGAFLGTALLPHEAMASVTGGYMAVVHYSFLWATFITLGIGLIFAAIGSMTGQPYRAGTESLAGTTTSPVAAH